jgi:hypothetical protein
MGDQSNPFDNLAAQLDFCINLGPGTAGATIKTVTKVLHDNGVRVLIAAIHDGWPHPQVELTVTIQDVTAKLVSQVVDPVLRKVGLPESAVGMFAAAAGEAAVRYLHKYTGQDRPRPQRPAGRPAAWDPSRPRRKEGR